MQILMVQKSLMKIYFIPTLTGSSSYRSGKNLADQTLVPEFMFKQKIVSLEGMRAG